MRKDLKSLMGKQLLFFDGATGTLIQRKPGYNREKSEIFNVSDKEFMTNLHKSYIDAGSNIITANTFGAYSFKFDNLEEIVKSGIENIKKAIEISKREDVYIALDIGPTGKLLEPMGDLGFEDCYDIFKETMVLGEKHGADLIIIETMSDTYEAKAAILAAKENTNLPIICTMTFDEKGQLLTGGDIQVMVSLLEGLGVDAIGMNCGFGAEKIYDLFLKLYDITSIPILIQPNAGLPKIVDNKTVYDETPEEFALKMKKFADGGASLLGGCCGVVPESIGEMIKQIKSTEVKEIVNKNISVVSSYNKSVILGEKPVIIGERINPTGKEDFKEALREGDISFIVDEAMEQRDCEAQILDVNVSLPEVDEVETMYLSVKELQQFVNLPLQIDSSNPAVIEKALRIYNGKAMVNSVTGKKSSMENIFPLVKKYGGVVVGLTIDEKGIPSTAEERFEVAKKILDGAAEYGIDKKNIIIDCLVLTSIAQQKESMETLKAVKLVKENLGVKTILGISNISFGLPEREILNSTFFTAALYAGLDCAIINPLSKPMMDTYNSFLALQGYDHECGNFLKRYGKNSDDSNQKKK